MTFHLSTVSLSRMIGVHPDLIAVVKSAILTTKIDFGISEGRRTPARQKRLLLAGASTTMRSRHLTGHAVDVFAYFDGRVAWDWQLYKIIADSMLLAAQQLRVPVVWGGDWKRFKDGCHFQLSLRTYPAVPAKQLKENS